MKRRRAAIALAVAALVAPLSACGGSASDSGQANGLTSEAEPSSVPGAELVGRWAHYDIVAYENPVMKTMIISYGFTDFSVEEGQLIESEQFCHADQVSDLPIETVMPDAATQAIRPASTPVEVSGPIGARRIRRPATPTPIGIRLDDPANEPLPSDPGDPRVVDDDGDGKPGVTVVVHFGEGSTGELYLARREIFAYDMTQDGPDSITGEVTDRSEQLLIGASVDVLRNIDARWEQVADRSLSPIILRRVSPDWDCGRLMAERDALFPPDPPIRW